MVLVCLSTLAYNLLIFTLYLSSTMFCSSAIRRAITSSGAARLPGASITANRLMSTAITRIDQTTLPTMSQAVVHNNICYISGQIDATGDDVESQTRNVLGKIDSLLAQAGTDKSKLLTASIWLKDIGSDFATMNKVWLEWVDENNKPARATTEANLAFPNLLVEVQVSAAIDD